MAYLLAFGVFLLFMYAVADKEQIEIKRERMNVWAWPLCYGVLFLMGLILINELMMR